MSGFEGLGVKLIRQFWCFGLVRSGCFGTERSDNQMEGAYFIRAEKGHHLEELFGNVEATSREWRPGGAPTND
jgi:hypothetical protein